MKNIAVYLWVTAIVSASAFCAIIFLGGFDLVDFLMSIFSMSVGTFVALLVINGLIGQKERADAAKAVAQVIVSHVADFHNDFIQFGRDRFGRARFNDILVQMNKNQNLPDTLSPEDRAVFVNILRDNRGSILANADQLEAGLRDIGFTLGWNFNPAIFQAIMTSRTTISKLRSVLRRDDADDEDLSSAIEHYFDSDGASSAVLKELFAMFGESISESNVRS